MYFILFLSLPMECAAAVSKSQSQQQQSTHFCTNFSSLGLHTSGQKFTASTFASHTMSGTNHVWFSYFPHTPYWVPFELFVVVEAMCANFCAGVKQKDWCKNVFSSTALFCGHLHIGNRKVKNEKFVFNQRCVLEIFIAQNNF